MRLTNELTLGVGLEEAWRAILDVPRVARALPGAELDDIAGPDGYRGTMAIKLGPVTTRYAGLAQLQDVDDDAHRATYRVRGQEAHGQGDAQATITLRAAARNGGTHLTVDTDLVVRGRQAQLGHGLMEDVAGGVLTEFAKRLEQALTGPDREQPAGGEVFDARRAVLGPLLERAAYAIGGIAAGLVLGRLLWGRR